MRYILAFLLPPLAVLLCGKPFSALLLFIMCCTLYLFPVSIILAIIIVASHKGDVRAKKMRKVVGRTPPILYPIKSV